MWWTESMHLPIAVLAVLPLPQPASVMVVIELLNSKDLVCMRCVAGTQPSHKSSAESITKQMGAAFYLFFSDVLVEPSLFILLLLICHYFLFPFSLCIAAWGSRTAIVMVVRGVRCKHDGRVRVPHMTFLMTICLWSHISPVSFFCWWSMILSFCWP